ncbi:MAG TPA: pyridoxal-phosphate dependent enzyme [Anaerolineales bacterium]|jgi:threonine synthase|nr:pyridoxal-phosphate dependent enzyme [Anaerolineales bacterium]
MEKVKGYQCSVCGSEYTLEEVTYTCPKDGGVLDVVLDTDVIRNSVRPEDILASADFSMWRYLPLLPVSDPGFFQTALRSVGWTPIYRPERLANQLGMSALWLKDESSNPSASFKDRASALLVARALEIGAEVIVTASTGNAGAALAGMAAAAGHKAVIFAPKTAPPAKIAQLLVYGSQVILVDGNYDDAVALAVAAANEYGWYCRNTGYNPFTAEGKKTAALEIWEQVLMANQLDRPLNVFVSVGDGNIISGVHKGFRDLYALGWLEHMPRIFGVQSAGSAAIANAYFSGTEEIKPVSASTLADSISVDMPSDGLRALRAATHTGGGYVIVEDEAILEGIATLGSVGVFSEPAASTAFAGLQKALADNLLGADDPALVLLTGSGLKDVKAAMRAAGEAPVIEPNLQALNDYFNQ